MRLAENVRYGPCSYITEIQRQKVHLYGQPRLACIWIAGRRWQKPSQYDHIDGAERVGKRWRAGNGSASSSRIGSPLGPATARRVPSAPTTARTRPGTRASAASS